MFGHLCRSTQLPPRAFYRTLITQMAPKRAQRTSKAAAESADEQPVKKRARATKAAAGGVREAANGAARPAKAATTAAGSTDAADSSRQYFLMKSEPDVFSIDDLADRPEQTEPWDGVRNHVAKKVLQSMREGDLAFFYHSNAKPPGVVGIMQIVKEAHPDPTQFDPKHKYHDAKSSEDDPKWVQVSCQLVRRLRRQISLEELKQHKGPGQPLERMALFKQSRLSVQAVTPSEWEFVLSLEDQQAE